MSLSTICFKQHAKENAIAKKWLLRGLLIAAGAHIGLIPLMAFIPPEVVDQPGRIEFVVTGPTTPVETPEAVVEDLPPEESVEALTEAVSNAELATETQVSGGISAPPPLMASFQSVPQPPPELASALAESGTATAALVEEENDVLEPDIASLSSADESALESDANESEATEQAALESVETESASSETSASESDKIAEPNLNALRARLSRARARQGEADADIDGDSGGPSETVGVGAETVRRGPSEGSEAGAGNGDGDESGSGSNTVSCRQCDHPAYPEEALALGVEGSPSVSIEYDENGNVVGAVLEQSSGNAALDEAALDAARSYQLDSDGQSGSVSVDIDFGIEGSERSRAAQQRGERDSVSTSAPEEETVSESLPAQAPSVPEAENSLPMPENRPEEMIGAPLPADMQAPPSDSGERSAPETMPAPEPVPLPAPEESAPVELEFSVPEPVAPAPAPPAPVAPVPDIAPPSEPVPLSEPAPPPEPAPAALPAPEPVSVPDMMPSE